MAFRSAIATALFWLGFAAPAFALEPDISGYRLDVRDEIVIDVYGEPSLSGQFVVGDGGVIDVALAGIIEVKGLTSIEVAERLEQVYGAKYLVNPNVTVRIQKYGSKGVEVLGAVKTPGVYYLNGPTSLLEMLAQSGGLSDKSTKEIQVRRGDDEPIVVKVSDLLANGAGNLFLDANDVVYVPEGQVVFVSGEVGTPGSIDYQDGLTITQAITMAGSWRPTANKRVVYILREGERIPVNVRRILQAKDANIALRPGDQVVVQESVF